MLKMGGQGEKMFFYEKTKAVFIILGLMLSAFAAPESPNSNSKEIEATQGHSITIPCDITTAKDQRSSSATFYWELNGVKIQNTTRRFIKTTSFRDDSNLYITRVDRERDSGEFVCLAVEDDDKSSISAKDAGVLLVKARIYLNIHWIGDATVQLLQPDSGASAIKKGDDVVLKCHLDASDDVHFQWFRNSERLTAKQSRHQTHSNRLRISSVRSSDNGVYRCMASNQGGTKYSTENFPLAVSGEDTSTIQDVPQNQIVPKGGTAYLHCQYLNADVVEWYYSGSTKGRLESNGHYLIHPNSTLQIDNVQESDQGTYNCIGLRSESTEVPQSYIADLKIAYIGDVTFEPNLTEDLTQILPEGGNFQLTCLQPDSLPTARKWWQSPQGHTISDSGQVRVDDDGRLILDQIKRDETGNYSCIAENSAGRKTRTIEIIVTGKPKLITSPISVSIPENGQSTLHCEFATPSPAKYTTLRWHKDGKPLKLPPTNSERLKIFKSNGTLVIYSTQIGDQGSYQCEIKTIGFRAIFSKPARLAVLELLKFSPVPVSRKLELGSTTRIHCKAQGTPPPKIHWERNDITDFSSHITQTNGTLLFTGVLASDRGTYTCIANSTQGMIKATISVDVVVAPKFSVSPKNPTEALEGQSVSIDCVVEGDPKPTIQWDKNLRMNDFDTNRFRVLPNGTLHITEVRQDDENKYGCTAGNSAGLNRREIQLIVHFAGQGRDASTVTKAVLITISVAAAYIILVVGLMVWCRYRRRVRKLRLNNCGTVEITCPSKTGDGEHTELKENTVCVKPFHNGSALLSDGGQKSDSTETTHSSSHSKKSNKSGYEKFTSFTRASLSDMKLVGRGEFGDVMVGKLSKLPNVELPETVEEDCSNVVVLVKALSLTKDENNLVEFKRELDMLAKMAHENVVKLMGLCRETEPHYLVVEHTDWGDLKQFLLATQKGTPLPALTAIQNVAIVHQICRGMEHVAMQRQLHKDLATRNCLVTSNLVVKVALTRLTREPYSHEYCKYQNQVIPLRWLPHEAVYEDEYSTKTDVYSLGVVILEVFTKGELPFPKINDNTFLTRLKEKALEWKPHQMTPAPLHMLQVKCWDLCPKNRPAFCDLVKDIGDLLKSL